MDGFKVEGNDLKEGNFCTQRMVHILSELLEQAAEAGTMVIFKRH